MAFRWRFALKQRLEEQCTNIKTAYKDQSPGFHSFQTWRSRRFGFREFKSDPWIIRFFVEKSLWKTLAIGIFEFVRSSHPERCSNNKKPRVILRLVGDSARGSVRGDGNARASRSKSECTVHSNLPTGCSDASSVVGGFYRENEPPWQSQRSGMDS